MNIGALLSLLIAAWVARDARRRGGRWVPWSLAALLLWVITLPLWLARRPLLAGERREGGAAWNLLKNFALSWTAFMALITFFVLGTAGGQMSEVQSDAEAVGTVLGAGLGLGLSFAAWFFPILTAVLVGFFLKKSTVEEGPPAAAET